MTSADIPLLPFLGWPISQNVYVTVLLEKGKRKKGLVVKENQEKENNTK
jgi:hypothetical protein